MFDLEKIREILTFKREKEKISLREIAAESGVSASTISRFLNNEAMPSTETISQLVKWLGLIPDEVFLLDNVVQSDSIPTVDLVVHQIKADRNLSPVDADTLAEMFKILYDKFAKKE